MITIRGTYNALRSRQSVCRQAELRPSFDSFCKHPPDNGDVLRAGADCVRDERYPAGAAGDAVFHRPADRILIVAATAGADIAGRRMAKEHIANLQITIALVRSLWYDFGIHTICKTGSPRRASASRAIAATAMQLEFSPQGIEKMEEIV